MVGTSELPKRSNNSDLRVQSSNKLYNNNIPQIRHNINSFLNKGVKFKIKKNILILFIVLNNNNFSENLILFKFIELVNYLNFFCGKIRFKIIFKL